MATGAKKTKVKKTPIKGATPDIPISDAALDSLADEIKLIKQDFKDLRNENRNIIIGVVVAFIFVIGAVAVEVILFHTRADKDLLNLNNQYFQEIQELRQENYNEIQKLQQEMSQKTLNLEIEIDNLNDAQHSEKAKDKQID